MIARRLARFLARPAVVDWLIARSAKTPYSDIVIDGETYMRRFWLFNPYTDEGRVRRWSKYLPSVRLHHIVLPDPDRHMHDHPWNARTFILRGTYAEVRQAENPEQAAEMVKHGADGVYRWRHPGSTVRLDFGQYHRIVGVSEGGVWTMFVTYRYRGTWGFLVDGVKVKWREYLGIPEKN